MNEPSLLKAELAWAIVNFSSSIADKYFISVLVCLRLFIWVFYITKFIIGSCCLFIKPMFGPSGTDWANSSIMRWVNISYFKAAFSLVNPPGPKADTLFMSNFWYGFV